MTSSSGFFFFEARELSIASTKDMSEGFTVKVEVGLCNVEGVCKWSPSNDLGYKSEAYKLAANSDKTVYSADVSSVFVKSSYVELNPANIQTLMGAYLNIKLVATGLSTSAAAAPAAAPPAKGAKAAPVPTGPIETSETLVEFTVLINDLFSQQGLFLSGKDIKAVTSSADHVRIESSKFSWNLTGDNDLAEYVLGSMILKFPSATLPACPVQLVLKYADVIDPKAKVPATPAELRAKYLENIVRLTNDQAKVANFTIVLNDSDAGADGLSNVLPKNIAMNGKIAFNKQVAEGIPLDQDIRQRSDLWSMSFSSIQAIFIPSVLKEHYANAISTNAKLTFTLTKTPTPDGQAAEGPPVPLKGELSLASLVTPGTTSTSTAGTFASASSPSSTITISTLLTDALVKADSSIRPLKLKPVDIITPKKICADPNSDVLRDLKDEITAVLRQIANEFVAMYPHELGSKRLSTSNEVKHEAKTLGERKTEFYEYIQSSGTYHTMKEKLKPKIYKLVAERYGIKAQALGKSEHFLSSTGAIEVDKLMSEMYSFLTTQTNLILNTVYSSTIIARDINELAHEHELNDLKETPRQLLARLLQMATDAEADGRVDISEQQHLERIHNVSMIVELNVDKSIIHSVYSQYGEFCLRLASKFATAHCARVDSDLTSAKSYFDRGREVLSVAVAANSTDWRITFLYACVLIEQEQYDFAETILNTVICSQTNLGNSHVVSNFEGYETDKLILANPLCYSIMASLYSIIGKPLRVRKALNLVNKAFVACDCQPPVATHGTPKRTIVYALSTACVYLYKHGFYRLVRECAKLARSSEDAIVQKIKSLGRVAGSVNFISYALSRGEALAALSGDISQLSKTGLPESYGADAKRILTTSLGSVREYIAVADAREDRIRGYIDQSQIETALLVDSNSIISSMQSAVSAAAPTGSSPALNEVIETQYFIQLVKLLIQCGRFQEAYTTALIGCSAHASGSVSSSASLLLLVGICCIRMERWADAEHALVEANLIDNRLADTRGYYSLLCLLSCNYRANEAEALLAQAIEGGLRNASLLRELATQYMALDKLSIAEDLIRRTITIESSQNESCRANPVTRKLFADILRGQNLAAGAIEQYQLVVPDESADMITRVQAAEKCLALIESLGRKDDAIALKRMISDIYQTSK